ncbi:MAG: hypothetical protein LBG43_00680 [Treponema sp.]|nr:hypothetical protein [Treponema sp.]
MSQIENAAQEGGRAGGVTCERERGGAGICAPASKGAQKSEAGFAGRVRPGGRSPPEVRGTAFMRQAGQGSPFPPERGGKKRPATPK